MLTALLPSVGMAQTTKKQIGEGTAPINITLPSAPSAASNTLLDKKIDPDVYVLGPGDVLSIFSWGNFQGQYQLTITPEGMLLVPEIGPIEVAGLTLSDARRKIAQDIGLRYRNVESIVSLVSLRVFKVFVGGAVNKPGAYPATAVTRTSEVITLAGGFFGEDEEKNKPQLWASPYIQSWLKLPAKRGIRVIRQNGDTLTADVLRFNMTGNPDFDPLLREGDEIFVPMRETNVNLHGIFGAVRNPGYFEYSSRDSLADLISLSHGITLDADSHNVEIVRFNPDNKTTYSMTTDLTSKDWNIALHSDDRVYVRPVQGYHEKYQVQLTGEFKYPGFYAIRDDSTTLSKIVAKAGGFTDMASLIEAEMTRVSAEELTDPEYERLKKMLVADMSESEYEYFKIKSRTKPGRVAVDFGGLFIGHDMSKDIVLRDNDVINVPRKRKVVNVAGEVANPGFLTYIPDADYLYYINMSGGFSYRAGTGNVTIIKGTTGEWQKPRKGKPLEPGDVILVPEKKKHNYVGLIKDTFVFVGNLATVYLVIRQASK